MKKSHCSSLKMNCILVLVLVAFTGTAIAATDCGVRSASTCGGECPTTWYGAKQHCKADWGYINGEYRVVSCDCQ